MAWAVPAECEQAIRAAITDNRIQIAAAEVMLKNYSAEDRYFDEEYD